MNKRLFLFAGYDANGKINSALEYQLHEFAKYGDVILYMDCDAPEPELSKIKSYCIYAGAARHGEYDFGSYKRAYQYAHDNDILRKYDYVYLVNDSVFGPTLDMTDILNKMESTNSDACGMVISKHRTHSFMESWFVRLNKKIFISKWFDTFISSITELPTKSAVTITYEHGLTNLIIKHGCTIDGIYTIHGRYTYNQPKRLFLRGCPFIKKSSFTRHNGAIGNQIKYILEHISDTARTAITNSVNQLYGIEYMEKFLTSNPFKILIRNISYATHKIKDSKI